jgi:phage shock protein PspC (stress-responsive transcriptional regulator)
LWQTPKSKPSKLAKPDSTHYSISEIMNTSTMKKNISINIGGIIFHIEEDSFESLKNYLNAITKYFSTYEDSKEIIADIENRIAEIFLSKLSDQKQVILEEDVESLMATMGTIADFEAANKVADESYTDDYGSSKSYESEEDFEYDHNPAVPKKLYRDEKRKLIGGVASGVAHYFHIDPLWVRLLFLLSFFDFFSFFTITGVVLVSYMIMWAVIPGSEELEEDEKVRHLFRDPEGKVVGGVASGIAAYFGIDVTIVRVGFVLSTILGGVGLIPYLIMWIITPEAKSLTERMQMEGQRITLENIEQKIKDSLNWKEGDEETPIAKLLLFPFRLFSKIISNFDGDLKPLFRFLTRVFTMIIGFALALGSTIATFALLVLLGVWFGLSFDGMVKIDDIPVEMIRNTIPTSAVIFGAITAWIPIIFVGILGISLIARQYIAKPMVSWVLTGVWVIGVVGAFTTFPIFATNFKEEGTQKKITTYAVSSDTPLRLLVGNSYSEGFTDVTLTLKGYEKSQVELVQKFSARGTSRQNAIENTQGMNYEIELRNDSTLIFPKSYELASGEGFRVQKLHMDMFVPYGQPFRLAEETAWIVRSTMYKNGFTERDMKLENLFVFEKEGLKCLNCKGENQEFETESGEFVKKLELGDFNLIKADGRFSIHILQAEKAYVKLIGSKESMEDISINLHGNELNISENRSSDVKIFVFLPNLEVVQLSGRTEGFMKGMDFENLVISLSERAELEAELGVENLTISLSDRAEMVLYGVSRNLTISAQDRTQLNASDCGTDNLTIAADGYAKVKANAAKNSHVNATERAEVKVSGAGGNE